MGRPSLQRLLIYISVLWMLPSAAWSVEITGRVIDARTGEALPGATTRIPGTEVGFVAGTDGVFVLVVAEPGIYTVSASHVGYRPLRRSVEVADTSVDVDLPLEPTVLPGEEVVITTTRVSAHTDAVAHSNLTRDEIERNYTVEDVPMFLAKEPGVYAYSDAGNGVGYSYIQVRGFDQRKVSVFVNGVPHNDPESHQFYWVDMPDLLQSASDIQVQRGVGASLYGASAAGGVVSLEVDPFTVHPELSFDAGFGSYGTRKFTLEGRSGLVDDRYSFYGRYSRVTSDGYRDQSWVDMWSYFVGVARYDGDLVNRFHAYGGPENLHLAYYGIDRATLRDNRRFNPLTYEDETDTFNQPHYELLTDWQISDRLSLSNTLFYIKGDGYFIQSWPWSTFADYELDPIFTRDSLAYDPWRYATVVDTQFVLNPADSLWYQTEVSTFRRDTLPSGDTVFVVDQFADAVLQRWVQNDFFGIAPRFRWEHNGGVLQFGGSFDLHHGYHFGQLRSVSPAPAGFLAGQHYYDYDGRRTSGILFAQENWQATSDLNVSAGLQFKWQRYALRNDRRGGVRYDLDFTSLSPRLGMVYRVTSKHAVFGNVAYAQHAPAHPDIFRPEDLEDPRRFFATFDPVTGTASDPLMQAEKLTSMDLGYRFHGARLKFTVNGFYQRFTDEIVASGGIDNDGNPIRTNAGRTIHRGVEVQFAVRPSRGLEAFGSLTWSDNYFDSFEQFFPTQLGLRLSNDTVYLPSTVIATADYSGNPIAGFPELMVNAGISFERPVGSGTTRLLGGAAFRHVGRIYLDNSGDEALSIDPYQVLDLRLGVRTGGLGIGSAFTVELLINNVSDELYSASGYTFDGVPYYYPAAERNFYLRLKTDW